MNSFLNHFFFQKDEKNKCTNHYQTEVKKSLEIIILITK